MQKAVNSQTGISGPGMSYNKRKRLREKRYERGQKTGSSGSSWSSKRCNTGGPYEVVAENFRSLLIYTDTYVKIKAAGCMVVFKGLHLEIETYTEDALKIKGQIRSVEFDDLLSERRVEG